MPVLCLGIGYASTTNENVAKMSVLKYLLIRLQKKPEKWT